ncbi:MAG: response regulator [Oscillospiraceae bacterium]|nr:response regulator [Oscillospiraceae bacterium]
MYKLVIAEDEYEIRTGLSDYFKWDMVGFELMGQAESGKQALEIIDNNEVDVLLTDIVMPDMTGIELAAELSIRKPNIKIVFLSGYRDFEYAQQAISYRVKKYLTKPTKYHELLETFMELKNELDLEKRTFPIKQLINYTEDEISPGKTIIAVNKYVSDNYKDASLKKAAEIVHMNPYYLSKFYKEKTGRNFSDLVLSHKMKHAAQFIKTSDDMVYEISEKVGYSNSKNFTRTFKKYFGVSPREYKDTP